MIAPVVFGLLFAHAGASTPVIRRMVAEVAIAQVDRPDPAWSTAERDCAGLVRFVYRSAFRAVDPGRVARGLFVDRRGRRVAFADAETLLEANMIPLGRSRAALGALESGDVIAFRREDASGPVHHLMLVAKGSRLGPIALYHPGHADEAVRVVPLRSLLEEAPREWRPIPENPLFLGYFRFIEIEVPTP